EKAPAQAEADQVPEESEDGSQCLSGFKLGVLSLGLFLTTFLVGLDNTIIATAIPKITTVFNSLDDVGWLDLPFSLSLCEIGSIICAVATISPMFIVGRAVAGSGVAAPFSGDLTITGHSVR
ncbi:MFS multidrug transporter, partial [Paraphaeosphaeria minitans]